MSPSLARSASDGRCRSRARRRHDREPLGRVVQREADDEQRAERRFAQGERGADGEPFTEIVEADADRNQDRQDPAAAAFVRGRDRVRAARCRRLREAGTHRPRPARTARHPETTPAAAPPPRVPRCAPSTSRNASSPTVNASRKVHRRRRQARRGTETTAGRSRRESRRHTGR